MKLHPILYERYLLNMKHFVDSVLALQIGKMLNFFVVIIAQSYIFAYLTIFGNVDGIVAISLYEEHYCCVSFSIE